MRTPPLSRIRPSTPVTSPRRTYSTLPRHGPFASACLGYTQLVQVLFVCTANMCRSPMAAALFRRLSSVEGDDAPEEVVVVVRGPSPRRARVTSGSRDRHGGGGNRPSGHRSTQVSPELVAGSDVVVGMARRHAREVVLLDAAAFGRTFTLKELVRRGDLVGRRQPAEELEAWLGRLHHGRQRTDLVGRSDDDDVSDPLGGPLGAYRTTARELGNAGRPGRRAAVGAARDPNVATVSGSDAPDGSDEPDDRKPEPEEPERTGPADRAGRVCPRLCSPARRTRRCPAPAADGDDYSCALSSWWWGCGWCRRRRSLSSGSCMPATASRTWTRPRPISRPQTSWTVRPVRRYWPPSVNSTRRTASCIRHWWPRSTSCPWSDGSCGPCRICPRPRGRWPGSAPAPSIRPIRCCRRPTAAAPTESWNCAGWRRWRRARTAP